MPQVKMPNKSKCPNWNPNSLILGVASRAAGSSEGLLSPFYGRNGAAHQKRGKNFSADPRNPGPEAVRTTEECGLSGALDLELTGVSSNPGGCGAGDIICSH
jgi:hypothetical protein